MLKKPDHDKGNGYTPGPLAQVENQHRIDTHNQAP